MRSWLLFTSLWNQVATVSNISKHFESEICHRYHCKRHVCCGKMKSLISAARLNERGEAKQTVNCCSFVFFLLINHLVDWLNKRMKKQTECRGSTPPYCQGNLVCGYSVALCKSIYTSPLFPLTSGCLQLEEACATPAKSADVSLCTDEECLMRRGRDTYKFTQGGWGRALLLHSALVQYGGRYLLPLKWMPQWMTVWAIAIQQFKEGWC